MALLDLKEIFESAANFRLLRSLSNDGDRIERAPVPSVPIKVWLYVPVSVWVPIFLAMLSSGTSMRWSVTWASTIAFFVYGLFLLQTLLAAGLNSLFAMLWVCGFYALVFFMIAWTLHRTLFLVFFWGIVGTALVVLALVVSYSVTILARLRRGTILSTQDVLPFWSSKPKKSQTVTLQLLPESDFDTLPLEAASKILGLAVVRAGETDTVVRAVTQVRGDALSIYVQVPENMEEVFAAQMPKGIQIRRIPERVLADWPHKNANVGVARASFHPQRRSNALVGALESITIQDPHIQIEKAAKNFTDTDAAYVVVDVGPVEQGEAEKYRKAARDAGGQLTNTDAIGICDISIAAVAATEARAQQIATNISAALRLGLDSGQNILQERMHKTGTHAARRFDTSMRAAKIDKQRAWMMAIGPLTPLFLPPINQVTLTETAGQEAIGESLLPAWDGKNSRYALPIGAVGGDIKAADLQDFVAWLLVAPSGGGKTSALVTAVVSYLVAQPDASATIIVPDAQTANMLSYYLQDREDPDARTHMQKRLYVIDMDNKEDGVLQKAMNPLFVPKGSNRGQVDNIASGAFSAICSAGGWQTDNAPKIRRVLKVLITSLVVANSRLPEDIQTTVFQLATMVREDPKSIAFQEKIVSLLPENIAGDWERVQRSSVEGPLEIVDSAKVDDTMYTMLGSSKTRWSPQMDVGHGKITLIQLRTGKDQHVGNIFGSFLAAYLRQSVYNRADMADAREHPPHLIIMDEAPAFIGAFRDSINLLLTQGRKSNMPLIFAAQNFGQLPYGIKDVVLANASLLQVAFNTQDDADECRKKLLVPDCLPLTGLKYQMCAIARSPHQENPLQHNLLQVLDPKEELGKLGKLPYPQLQDGEGVSFETVAQHQKTLVQRIISCDVDAIADDGSHNSAASIVHEDVTEPEFTDGVPKSTKKFWDLD